MAERTVPKVTSPGPPDPTVMPVDRARWRAQLNLSNFVNAYYQFRDLQRFTDCRRVLIVGPGQGFEAHVLKWRGYDVTTFDIDNTFEPDVQGSVHQMTAFGDGQFDAVIASHVIEHLAEAYLDASLKELSRVARYALVYLPVAGRHSQVRIIPGIRGWDWSLIIDLFNFLQRPDGITPRYCQAQHFWEVGRRGFRVSGLKKRMRQYFLIIDAYRNRDWTPSYNFVLKSTGQHER